ncbi:MAG: aspartate 1-decarboxylase [Rhodothermales bacterium]
MTITMFRAKLHQLRVTEANLQYEGSITIDLNLLDAAGILPYEKVQIVNNNNGARLETYTIPGERGERTVCLNGAAARKAQIGDSIIVIAYADMTLVEAQRHQPRVVITHEDNTIKEAFDLNEDRVDPLVQPMSLDVLGL